MSFAQSIRESLEYFGVGASDGRDEDYWNERADEPRRAEDDETRVIRLGAWRDRRCPSLTFGCFAPASYEEARPIADHFRGGSPVLVDLGACDQEAAARIVDFCSGLAYAVEGTLIPVAGRVYLLLPDRAEFSGDEENGAGRSRFYNRR